MDMDGTGPIASDLANLSNCVEGKTDLIAPVTFRMISEDDGD